MCEDLKVLALCEGRLQAHVEPLRVAGCSLHVESRSAWQMLRHYPQLAARARRERPQIILANAPAWHATIARRLASLAHAQTTLVIRGDLWAELNEMLKKRYAASPIRSVDVKIRRRLGASNIPSVDRLIAVSDYIRGLVIECTGVPEERVTTVHPAVDVEHFLPSDEDPARLRAEIGVSVPHLICAVTNFNFHRKIEGLSRFMPVLHELLSRRDDVAVALAGGGAYYDEFRERHARELAHDRMLLLGFFKPITKLYHASDALVHFTLLDGIPNTAAEANACGLPVVANDFPSMLECITNSVNGYLVPSEVDMEMTVSAIERLLDDSDLRVRMGQAGRERVITTRAPEGTGRQRAAILRAQVGA